MSRVRLVFESLAASCGLGCQRLSEDRKHASRPHSATDRGQHLG